MFAQPQQEDNRGEVVRAGLHRDRDQSPRSTASGPAITSGPAIGATKAASTTADASYRHDHPIVGHRLANGYMAIHAPGQPCGYCAGAAPVPKPSKPASPRRGGVMRALRSFVTASTVLAATVAALTVALGGSRAEAATPAATTGVTWHKLALINNWRSSQGCCGTGAPSWAVRNGIVYLSGSIHQSGGSNLEFARLPATARPARNLYLSVFTWLGTTGHVDIYPDGRMVATSAPSTGAQMFTSLAAVSFPAASTARHKLALLNGWKSSQATWGTGDPSYSVRGGMVYLSGGLHQASGSNQQFAVLPKAARPASQEYITVYTNSYTTGVLLIYPNGVLATYGGAARQFSSLAGISYPQTSVVRHKLALIDGWESGQGTYGTGDPSYSVVGGVVHLSGSLVQPGGGTGLFAVLPPGVRPAHSLVIQVYTYNGSVGSVTIRPNGQVIAYSITVADAQDFTSLAAISYPLKS